MICSNEAALRNGKRIPTHTQSQVLCIWCLVDECLSLNESDLATDEAPPGQSRRRERKRRAGGKRADSAGMVARNRSRQMGQHWSAGGVTGSVCVNHSLIPRHSDVHSVGHEANTVDTVWTDCGIKERKVGFLHAGHHKYTENTNMTTVMVMRPLCYTPHLYLANPNHSFYTVFTAKNYHNVCCYKLNLLAFFWHWYKQV